MVTSPGTHDPAGDRALFAAALAANLRDAPEVARNFTDRFQNDPVGPQWLAHVAQQTVGTAPAPAGEIVLITQDEVLDTLAAKLPEIWQDYAAGFEAADPADHPEMIATISKEIAAELPRLLELVVQANGDLQTASTVQSDS